MNKSRNRIDAGGILNFKRLLYLLICSTLIPINVTAKDYTGLKFNISVSPTTAETAVFDSNGNLWVSMVDSDKEINIGQSLPSVSWSTGYTTKFDALLPYNRVAYIGWELGGSYLLDDISSSAKQSPSDTDYVVETKYRGHHILSGGLKLGLKLQDSLVYIDGGGVFANILQKAIDYDSGAIDFANSPHTQDLLEGYYIGGGFEYLFTENIGATFNIRHYHFAANEQFGGVISENDGAVNYYKYSNELTQVQFGLAYYFRQK
jgi:hypothetical protein